jgi:hypothetical protein
MKAITYLVITIVLTSLSYALFDKQIFTTTVVNSGACKNGGNCTLNFLNVSKLEVINETVTNLDVLGDINNTPNNMQTNDFIVDDITASGQISTTDIGIFGKDTSYTATLGDDVGKFSAELIGEGGSIYTTRDTEAFYSSNGINDLWLNDPTFAINALGDSYFDGYMTCTQTIEATNDIIAGGMLQAGDAGTGAQFYTPSAVAILYDGIRIMDFLYNNRYWHTYEGSYLDYNQSMYLGGNITVKGGIGTSNLNVTSKGTFGKVQIGNNFPLLDAYEFIINTSNGGIGLNRDSTSDAFIRLTNSISGSGAQLRSNPTSGLKVTDPSGATLYSLINSKGLYESGLLSSYISSSAGYNLVLNASGTPIPTVGLYDMDTTIPSYSTLGANPAIGANEVGRISPVSANYGGMQFLGFTDTDEGAIPFFFTGYSGDTTPTAPAVVFRMARHSGTTTATSYPDNQVGIQFRNWASNVVDIYGNGSIYATGDICSDEGCITSGGGDTSEFIKNNTDVQFNQVTVGDTIITDGLITDGDDEINVESGYLIYNSDTRLDWVMGQLLSNSVTQLDWSDDTSPTIGDNTYPTDGSDYLCSITIVGGRITDLEFCILPP